MKFLAQLALKGPGQAIGLAVALAMLGLMVPPFALLSAAVIGLVCLQADGRNAVMVLIASTVVASVLGGVLAGMPLIGVAMMLVLWAPVAAASMWLRRSGSLSQAILVTALLGVTVVFAMMAAVTDYDAAWQGMLNEQILMPLEGGPDKAEVETVVSSLQRLGPLLPGLIGMSVMLTVQVAMLMARWMQSQLLKPAAFAAEYRQLTIGRVPMLLIAAVIGLAAATQQPVWQSLALVLGWLPVSQGVAVMHAFCGRHGFAQGKPLLVLGWILLILLPHFVVFIAAVGAVDNWMNFRRRWSFGLDSQSNDNRSDPDRDS